MFKALTVLVSLTTECLGAFHNCIKQYADQKRRDLDFALGEQVLLSKKYLRLKLLRDSCKYTAKLMPRNRCLHAVEAKVGEVSCLLAFVQAHIICICLCAPFSNTTSWLLV
jgi:hypothetical protein